MQYVVRKSPELEALHGYVSHEAGFEMVRFFFRGEVSNSSDSDRARMGSEGWLLHNL